MHAAQKELDAFSLSVYHLKMLTATFLRQRVIMTMTVQ